MEHPHGQLWKISLADPFATIPTGHSLQIKKLGCVQLIALHSVPETYSRETEKANL